MGSAEEEITDQSRLRANPCCCISSLGPNRGKHSGTPPLMGLDLSNTASGRTYSTSSPLGRHQDVTFAPNRYTSADEPFLCVRTHRGRPPSPRSNRTEPGMANAAVASCTMRSLSADARVRT